MVALIKLCGWRIISTGSVLKFLLYDNIVYYEKH